MFRNYLTVGVRALLKSRVYAAINILGLAIGMAACLLILLYVRYEMSYDAWLPNARNIYQVQSWSVDRETGTPYKMRMSQYVASTALQKDFPQIESSGRLMPNALMGAGTAEVRRAGQTENTYEEGITFADQGILDIFKLPMVYGDRAHARHAGPAHASRCVCGVGVSGRAAPF